MLARSSVWKQISRFYFSNSTPQTVNKTNSQYLASVEKAKQLQTPIHLRPYNKQKYEVPMKKIKKNSGYSMVQIEPFPRARIMKVCYHILAELRKQIPEDYLFRIFLEQRTKWIMDIVDRQEDVQRLEELFGRISIEIFIRNLANNLEAINVIRQIKPWQMSSQDQKQIQRAYVDQAIIPDQEKFPLYKKSQRKKANIL